MPLNNFYLSVPSADGIFVGTRASPDFEEGVSLYEFERTDENPSMASFWLAPEAVEWALESVAKRVDSVCISVNRLPKKTTGVLTIETTENGNAELLSSGNWKVVKKAKVKYVESNALNSVEPTPLEKPNQPTGGRVTREPEPEPESEPQISPPTPPPRVKTDEEFELRVKKDDMMAKLDANIAEYEAKYKSQYTITVSVSPSGAGTASVKPDQKSYAAGAWVTVTANPAGGYVFKNWTGASIGSVNPVAIVMDGNKALTAVFERKSQSLPPTPPTPPSPQPPQPTQPTTSTKPKSHAALIVFILIIVCGIAGYYLMRPSVESLFDKGKEFFDAGNFTEAVVYFSKAIKRSSDPASIRGWRGLAYYELKNYESAAADFNEASRLAPKNARYSYLLGDAYSGMKNYDGAVTAYTKAIEIEPGNADYYFGRAGAYSAKKSHQEAVDDFTRAININPNDARYHNSRGGDYRNMGDYDKAYIGHSDAIRLNPNEAKYYNNRGVAQILRKKYTEAIPDFSEAIRLAPTNAQYYNNRGDAYIYNKDFAMAVADYRMAVQYDSGNAKYRNNLEKTEQRLSAQEEPIDPRDGLRYRAVKIGGKIWMAQNMNYRSSTGNSWCYDNNNSNCDKYGRLYDWSTAKTACPSGWHLPSRKEWRDLITAAGAASVAGKKLKAASPEWDGTDDHKFSALPGGYRDDGKFGEIGTNAGWWTATENSSSNAYIQYMESNFGSVSEVEYDKSSGYSVRCVMDAR